MDRKLRIAILFGGRSGEHEVSLASARSVLDVLDPDTYEVYQIGITHEGAWLTGENALESFEKGERNNLSKAMILADPSKSGLFVLRVSDPNPTLEHLTDLDVVFPILHGTYGEDGTLQGLLEMADLAYVGAGVVGSSVGMDKGVFKDIMKSNDIPVVGHILILRREIETDIDLVLQRAESLAAYPLFAKPANLGSSVGVSRCLNRSDLREGLLEAARYDRRVMVERGVNAREIEISVLGNDDPQASIPGEIIPSRDFYSYEAKYINGTSTLLIPAPIPDKTAKLACDLAIRAYKAIDCAGMARVDFLMDKDTDELFLNEVNTIPGFTGISMYPKLWEASGLPYAGLVTRLIELALERKSERSRTERRFRREQ